MAWSKICKPKGYGGLGLRDLRKFNLDMLAKQCSRLLQQSNGIVSRIMKARYYPNTQLLNAKLGNNPSYVWRSLIAAMEVVKAGSRRQIGDGKDTRIWHVPWLPCEENGCLTTPMPDYLEESTVSNLMDDTGKCWDLEVIDDVFNSRDAELIRRVPIPLTDGKDA